MIDNNKNDIETSSSNTKNVICKTKGLTHAMEDKFIQAAANNASVIINIGMIDSEIKDKMIDEIQNSMISQEFDKRALYGTQYKIFVRFTGPRISLSQNAKERAIANGMK